METPEKSQLLEANLESPEADFENFEDFEKWVVEKAEKSDDYVEFYREIWNKYLDFLLTGKAFPGSYPPALILRETYKIALRKNKSAEKLLDEVYELDVQRRAKMLELAKQYNISINKINRTPEYKELMEQTDEKMSTLLGEYMREVTGVDIEQLIAGEFSMAQIFDYIKKAKDCRILNIIKNLDKPLMQMSYGNGDLVPKCIEIQKINTSFAMDNHINYGPLAFHNLLGPAIAEKQWPLKDKLQTITHNSKEAEKIAEEMI